MGKDEQVRKKDLGMDRKRITLGKSSINGAK